MFLDLMNRQTDWLYLAELFYFGLWVVVPWGLQLVLLRLTRRRRSWLRWCLLTPAAALVLLLVLCWGTILITGVGLLAGEESWMVLWLAALGLGLVATPLLLLQAGLWVMGWALAWGFESLALEWEGERALWRV